MTVHEMLEEPFCTRTCLIQWQCVDDVKVMWK